MNIALKKVIDTEYKYHPLATLVDYYKLVFQAVFGPAHILDNKDMAYNVLLNEISLLEDDDDAKILDLSFETDFIRVDLHLLKRYSIDTDDFWKILLKSAEFSSMIDKNDWYNIWENAENYLSDFMLKGFKNDKIMLTSKAENLVTVHHSNIYKVNYNPHYRVVSKELWQSLLKND